ncbi:membrane protein [Sorangium cellulosum]|uniref:Membrane protein n=1 Tax=Sorangium cellulosum TaxID=56 RepID=A0A4P2QBH7_SORCE|nr:DUF5985 family protein [Sorangium cellulosum]AUX26463.1 membrane protein [Sorangium cellulosum]
MAAAVYILCALTSAACTALLLRGYAKRKVRLLLWSGLCFAGLTANNILLFVDFVLIPDIDFSPLRHLTALIGLSLLLYGLIWDLRE